MNPRRAAALASVVWYLMHPPLPHYNANSTNPVPSLAHWMVVRTFPSQEECVAQKANPWDQCVASDDPRLKEK
jgi:hypothetical protein